MPRLVEEEKNEVAPTDEAVLIRHGKAPRYTPKSSQMQAAPPGETATTGAAPNSADPTLPFALIAALAVAFFALLLATVGFLFRRQLIYPLLHQAGLTDEFGNLLMKAPWHR